MWRMAHRAGLPHPDFLPPLTSSQIGQAMAYERVEPSGAVRDDFRIGTVLEVMVNMNRRKGTVPFRWTDVFTEHDSARTAPKRKSPKDIWTFLVAGAKARGLVPAKAKE
jgi:hypothetical protein